MLLRAGLGATPSLRERLLTAVVVGAVNIAQLDDSLYRVRTSWPHGRMRIMLTLTRGISVLRTIHADPRASAERQKRRRLLRAPGNCRATTTLRRRSTECELHCTQSRHRVQRGPNVSFGSPPLVSKLSGSAEVSDHSSGSRIPCGSVELHREGTSRWNAAQVAKF